MLIHVCSFSLHTILRDAFITDVKHVCNVKGLGVEL